ncbi:MAG: hypothetical protein RI568_15815 [Natronomonas sp.]|uniref:hypothetical protein n=1 Tax=Natronomonas sp. TaxID=2184060 RepID=UPI0028709D22|nr:hypothetical protein [Natronomonas sp.]MDR9432148.1 hypothetical protein [Natronomonas sp.]
MSEGPSVEDVLQVAQRALAKVNELEDDLEELRARREEDAEELTALKLRMQEHDEETPYAQLTLDDKIGMVREHAFRKAAGGHGRATLDYDDVMWSVFDGEPGPNHCYKLLRLAAGLTDTDDDGNDRPVGGEIPGFQCRDPAGENYHLAVDAEEAKRGVAFYPGNKDSLEGVGSR